MNKLLIAIATTGALALLPAAAVARKAKHAHHAKRLEIAVTTDGFSPTKLTVQHGKPVVLAVTRKTDQTCATKIVVHTAKDKKVEKQLPLNKTVEIPVTFARSGELTYACGMGHLGGVIKVR